MKPYLAVLFDSLLESTRSYVLWILLGAWTLLLGLLFPLHFTSAESYQFLRSSFRADSSAGSIMDSLAEASVGKGSRSQRAIYAKLTEQFQRMMKDRKETKRRVSVGLLIEELNKLLLVEGLYSEQDWPTVARSEKYKELIDKTSLTAIEREKLNRKLIDSAFPATLNSPEGRATWVAYAGIKLGNPLPFTKEVARPFIEQAFYPIIMWIGLSIVMLFIAIIITSPLIPDIFQPGSLHLMLSKPISRSLLFLTKFLGGCIFVFFNVTFVLLGLYLYSGIQLEIWNIGILKCIPLFVFSFLVYYSVSCLAGLIWKNSIISVVVTIVFWSLCFVLGIVYSYFRFAMEEQPTLRGIYSVNDSLWAKNRSGRLLVWDKKSNSWNSAFGGADDQRLLGPVALGGQKAIYFARTENNPFGFGGRDDFRLEMAKIPDVYDSSDSTFTSPLWSDSRLDSGPKMPASAEQIIPWKDTLAVTSSKGVYVFDPTKEREPENQFESVTNVLKTFGLNTSKTETAFKPIVKDIDLGRPYDFAVSASFKTLVAYSKGELIVWQEQGDEFVELYRASFDFDKERVVSVGCNDSNVIVCPEGNTPVIVSVGDANKKSALSSVGESRVRQVISMPDNRFAIVDYSGDVWIVTEDGAKADKPNLSGQGQALAASVNADGLLWVAYGVRNAAQWDLGKNTVAASCNPRMTVGEIIHYFFVRPMYTVAQRPAELEDLSEILMSNAKKSMALSRNDMDMMTQKKETKSSVFANIAFITVVLGICCLYLYRQDL